MKIELAKTEIIHFVGIGGIGMSGLSLIMNNVSDLYEINDWKLSLKLNVHFFFPFKFNAVRLSFLSRYIISCTNSGS